MLYLTYYIYYALLQQNKWLQTLLFIDKTTVKQQNTVSYIEVVTETMLSTVSSSDRFNRSTMGCSRRCLRRGSSDVVNQFALKRFCCINNVHFTICVWIEVQCNNSTIQTRMRLQQHSYKLLTIGSPHGHSMPIQQVHPARLSQIVIKFAYLSDIVDFNQDFLWTFNLDYDFIWKHRYTWICVAQCTVVKHCLSVCTYNIAYL